MATSSTVVASTSYYESSAMETELPILSPSSDDTIATTSTLESSTVITTADPIFTSKRNADSISSDHPTVIIASSSIIRLEISSLLILISSGLSFQSNDNPPPNEVVLQSMTSLDD